MHAVRLLGAIALFAPLSSMGALVGSTSGAFSVTPSGAASYSIPIVAPPVAGGVFPQLAIEYSSQGGNGPLGLGFTLSGLSVITRCPQTFAQDGAIFPLNFTASDRFCLDGQRLVVASGTYGAVGAEYRTELESFSRIRSIGGSAGDPASWTVQTKSGLTMSYGSTASSRIEARGRNDLSTPGMVWGLSTITDTVGNSSSFSYLENASTGEFVPTSISAPGVEVTFNWQPRPDPGTQYTAGAVITRSLRLDSIVTQANGSEVRKYVLGYETSLRTLRSQLTSIQECGMDGGWQCFPATTFEWQAENLPTTTSGLPGFSSPICGDLGDVSSEYVCAEADKFGIQYPDLNGDGLADVCWRANGSSWGGNAPGGIRCQLSTGSGWGPDIATGLCDGGGSCNNDNNYSTIGYADFDGDGKDDLVYRSDQGFRVFRWTGSDFQSYYSNSSCRAETLCDPEYYPLFSGYENDPRTTWQYPDVNGDGRADMCYRGLNGLACDVSSGPLSWVTTQTSICRNGPNTSGGCNSSNNYDTIAFVDMNADGRADIVYRGDQGIQIYSSYHDVAENKTKFALTLSTTVCANASDCGAAVGFMSNSRNKKYKRIQQYPDVNGDGLADLCYRAVQGFGCYLNKGDGLGLNIQTDICANNSVKYGVCNDADNYGDISLADFDGDGMSDLVYRSDNGLRVWRSTGDGFALMYQSTVCDNDSNCNESDKRKTLRYVDLTGDGLPEIVRRMNAGLRVASTNQIRASMVQGIQNGVGARIELTYAPLTDSAVYTRGASGSYPEPDFQGPIYVVSAQRSNNGIGGWRSVAYEYSGARMNRLGRGSLGFARMEVHDLTAGVSEITEYRQDFPFIGMVSRSISQTSAGLVFEDSTTTYNSYQTAGGAHFSYPEQVVARSWEVNGTNRAYKRVTTTNDYSQDQSGNLLGSTVLVRECEFCAPYVTSIVNTYGQDSVSSWFLGRLTRSVVTRSGPNQTAVVRTTDFEYDNDGLLLAEIIEPGLQEFRIRTQYGRDAYGNIETTTVSGIDILTRSSTQVFGPEYLGRFNTVSRNALGHEETRTFDPGSGNVATRTSPNGLTTTYSYDALGRPTGETFNEAGIYTTKSIAREWCAPGLCAANEVFFARSYDNSGAESYVYFDVLEREVRKVSKNGAGQWVEVRTEFNAKGEVARKSNPALQGETIYWTTLSYDAIGRLIGQSEPAFNNQTRDTTFAHDGLTVVQTVEGQKTTRVSNVLGKPVSVKDNRNGEILYTYDAFENLVATRDGAGKVISTPHNRRGHKYEMTDPNMGYWQYRYNVLGELIWQQDALGQTVDIEYDALGRMKHRQEAEGATDWVYDTEWKGALTSVSSPDYIRTYTYNAFGGVESETVSIASIPAPAAPPSASTALQNFTPISGRSGSPGTELRFTLTVPAGASDLMIYTAGGQGDADLYVKHGSAPSTTSYSCRSISSSNSEACYLPATAGVWHVLVRGYSSFQGLSLTGSFAYNGGATVLQNGVPLNGVAGYSDTSGRTFEFRYIFSVPIGATAVKFETSGGFGNSELYVRYSSAPTTTAYDCHNDGASNSAVCDSSILYNGVADLSVVPYLGVPPPGTYHVLVRAKSSTFRGVRLLATYSEIVPLSLSSSSSTAGSTAGPASATAPSDFASYQEGGSGGLFTPKRDSDGTFLVSWEQPSCPASSLETCEFVEGPIYSLEMALAHDYSDAQLLYQGSDQSLDFNEFAPGTYYFRVRAQYKTCTKKKIGAPPNYCEGRQMQGSSNFYGSGSTAVEPWRAVLQALPLTQSAEDDFPEPPANTPDNPAKSVLDWVGSLFSTETTESQTSGFASTASMASTLDRTITYTYDSLGRQYEITYPASSAGPAFKVRNGYNANGAWDSVTNASTGVVYWQALEWDRWGPSKTRYGNSIETANYLDAGSGLLGVRHTGFAGSSGVQSLEYEWDALGNLKAREDNRQGLRETFSYDDLNRLETNTLYGVPGITSGTSTLSVTYDAAGNILSKTGKGAYTYHADRPNAVKTAGGFSYTYNANGSMLTAGGRQFNWTSYNLPSHIQEGGSATSFLYGPERQRIRQSSSSSARGGRLTYFFHPLYEEQAFSTYTEAKHYVSSPEGTIAVETIGPTNKTEYFHRDHLGSIDVITNAAGQIVQRLSFDAFGLRRGAAWESKTVEEFVTNWGYTGHQQQDDFGLIHMNGRVYDPGLGRFISADPFVQAPQNTQSYNRYSYVMNNPLSATDPSGFFWKQLGKFLKGVVRQVVPIALTFIPGLNVIGAMAVGFAGGLLSSGGDIGAAVLGGLTAGFMAGVGQAVAGAEGLTKASKVLIQGSAGGFTSVVQGGKFANGFLAAALPVSVREYAPPAWLPKTDGGQMALAAAVGGTASVLGGGKFANGAITAAISYAFGRRTLPAAKGGEGGEPISEERARERMELAVQRLREAVREMGDPELIELADRMTVSYVHRTERDADGFTLGTADFETKSITLYESWGRQSYGVRLDTIFHEFRHLQSANYQLRSRYDMTMPHDVRPIEQDAGRWAGRMVGTHIQRR